jgi:uncharacterized protein (DUF427 family)
MASMAKATWNGAVIAQSDAVEIVEGNVYFPPDALRRELVQGSGHTTFCPWKGEARYYHLTVDGQVNENAAWYYPATLPKAKHIEGYVAFWNGVTVER